MKKDFPIFKQKIKGKPLVYLDNASTTQKPKVVIDALVDYYSKYNANVHRGVYFLSEKATELFEGTREKVRLFINASSKREIIFTKGTTDGINLVASNFHKDDEVIISEMEHHSNIVPWQLRGCKIKVIPMNDKGELDYEEFENMITRKTKLVSLVHISNSLGTVNPIKKFIKKAHEYNVPVLIDGAQSAAHTKIDVEELDCDFFVFSSHKMYGPTGLGILYGKEKLLNEMPPYQGGGDMIKSVKFEKTIYNDLPYKFEAGTPNIADVVAFGAAIDYLNRVGIDYIQSYEADLLHFATKALLKINGLKIIGTAKEKSSIISFVIEGLHPHDIGTILDEEGIAVRSGQHCTEPVMNHFKIPATTRASFGIYNDKKDIDALVKAILKAKKIFNV